MTSPAKNRRQLKKFIDSKNKSLRAAELSEDDGRLRPFSVCLCVFVYSFQSSSLCGQCVSACCSALPPVAAGGTASSGPPPGAGPGTRVPELCRHVPRSVQIISEDHLGFPPPHLLPTTFQPAVWTCST